MGGGGGINLFGQPRDNNGSVSSTDRDPSFSLGRDFRDNVEVSGWGTFRRVLNEFIFGKPGGFNEGSTHHGDGLSISMSRSAASNQASRLMRAGTIMPESRRREVPWIIKPGNRFLRLWEQLLMILGAWSAYITPLEFCFFNVPPLGLRITDNIINIFFLVEIVLTFFVAFKDKKRYTTVTSHKDIAVRYLTSWFIFDLLAVIPWDLCYIAAGAGFNSWEQVFRWLTWVRVLRAGRVMSFLNTLQKDIRLSYFAVRIVTLLVVELYFVHVAGCFFYFLALTYPPDQEDLTWIGSLTLGNNSYANFRELDLFTVYVTSIYWATVTMATIGYGDIHPVNPREMIFAMIYISFDLILSAYLVGNITALVVKGGATTRFREKMAALIKYINRNHVPHHLRHQLRQFETEQVDDDVLEEFPVSIRHKVSRSLFWRIMKDCYLFRGCSDDFMSQVVAGAVPEYFFPQEVVILQRDAADHMFIVAYGSLEETSSQFIPLSETQEELEAEAEQGTLKGEAHHLGCGSAFGEVALLCNIPQPYTVTAKDICQVLRVDKDLLQSIIATNIPDGRIIIENLLARTNEAGSRFAGLSSEIRSLIAQQEAELTMATIYAASRGDIEHLKDLVKAGASSAKGDYDGRTPLHLAAAGGYEEVVRFLIIEGADVNVKDNFGTTPLLEALRAGNDVTAKILVEKGASVNLQEAGTDLCNAVIHGDSGLLQRLLKYGVDPNSADYDLRTPLHIAAAEGFLQMSRILVENGADVMAKDRWGNTALDEARRCGSLPLVNFLEEAVARKTGVAAPTRDDQAQASTAAAAAVAAAAAAKVAALAEGGAAAASSSSRAGGAGPAEPDSSGDHATAAARAPADEASALHEPSPARTAAASGAETPVAYSRTPYGGRSGQGAGPGGLPGRKRVTLYPFPPWRSAQRRVGRVVWAPATLAELLEHARAAFGSSEFKHVLSVDGGEIDSLDLVLNGDKLYLASDKDLQDTQFEQ